MKKRMIVCLCALCVMAVALALAACTPGESGSETGEQTPSTQTGECTELSDITDSGTDMAEPNTSAQTEENTDAADTVGGAAETEEPDGSMEESSADNEVHMFTIEMEETVYPTDFDWIRFKVIHNEPGISFVISAGYTVYRMEGDKMVPVGWNGTEELYEATPLQEDIHASVPFSFSHNSLLMWDEFTEGIYRVYHDIDKGVYAEFELKN